jgi:hypothetical protein
MLRTGLSSYRSIAGAASYRSGFMAPATIFDAPVHNISKFVLLIGEI